MSQPKLKLPATPSYIQPVLGQTNNANLSTNSNNLLSGNLPSWLQSAINPNFSAQAIQGAQASLLPAYNQSNLDIKNQLAASNSLDSSTYSDALAKNAFNLDSQLQGIGLTQGINDAYSANANKLNLYGTGLNGLQQSISNDAGFVGAQNSFNQQNYENQVGAAIAQRNPAGGLGGALTGGIGGALAGLPLAGATGGLSVIGGGLAGGLAGGLSYQATNTGGNLLQGGAGIYGQSLLPNYLGNQLANQNANYNGNAASLSYMPGSSATNYIGGIDNPWNLANPSLASQYFR